MNTGVVMIILMLLPGGDLSSTFVNTGSAPECEQRLARIRPILAGSGTELKEAGCFRSAAQFDDFDHDPPADAPRHAFLVDLDGDEANVRKLASAEECRAALEATGRQRSYCTTSTQDMTGGAPQ